MEENFEPVARTRANYYTPGSPVQFVCVELLKGEVSGEHAVCLTFKNISRVTLTALEIHFKCKGVDGVILCEDEFEYRDLAAKPGESFGMDDAVFVTQKAITSVDVTLRNVYSGRKVVHLESIKRVRLPAPRRLSVEMQKALETRMNRTGMKFMPQVFENGWYCACGAFHPKEEDTVYCSECGSDRILLQNALNTLLQPEAPVRQPEPQPAAQPVRPAMRLPLRWTRPAWCPAPRSRRLPAFCPASRSRCARPGPLRRTKRWRSTAPVWYPRLLPPRRPACRQSRWTRRTTAKRKTPATASLRRSSAGCRPSPPSCVRASPCAASCILSS